MTEQRTDRELIEELVKGMSELSTVVQSHQYILTAITASLREMDSRLPDAEENPKQEVAGETRGETTAFRLPGNRGTLLVTMSGNTATLSVRTHPTAPKIELAIKGQR